MLKLRSGARGSGPACGEGLWWAWPAEALAVDAVLVYAQAGPGHGTGADCSFAVWSRAPRDAMEAQAVVEAILRRDPAAPGALQLVPIAQASAGPGEAEVQAVEACIRATTVQKFGPVRWLRPSLVVALAFDGIAPSARHKSGLALRSPRMLGLHVHKPLHEAATLATLQALLPQRA